MIGQYTLNELYLMGKVQFIRHNLIIRHVSKTVNYYRLESDGSWTNYNCRTI